MLDPAAVQARFRAEIREAAARFQDHEGMSEGTILGWMTQFSGEHLPLAKRILEAIKYFSAPDIRDMARALAMTVVGNFGGDPRRVIFVPIEDHPGSGAETIARALQDEPAVRGTRIVRATALEGLNRDEAAVVVFIDDFSGTGDQFEDWWLNIEPLVRPLGIPIVIGLLVATTRAKELIHGYGQDVLSVHELDESSNIFSEHCGDFDQLEKGAIIEYCRRTGCDLMYVMGYGSSGLLIAFTHGCPDDSLPILWCDFNDWRTLFKRHAI